MPPPLLTTPTPPKRRRLHIHPHARPAATEPPTPPLETPTLDTATDWWVAADTAGQALPGRRGIHTFQHATNPIVTHDGAHHLIDLADGRRLHTPAVNQTGAFTWVFVCRAEGGTGGQYLLSCRENGNPAHGTYYLNGKATPYNSGSGTTPGSVTWPPTDKAAVAFVNGPGADARFLYVDGQSGTTGTGATYQASMTATVGAYHTGTDAFNGRVYGFALFPYALTTTQIEAARAELLAADAVEGGYVDGQPITTVIPPTVAHDGSVDVTNDINAWLATLPDGNASQNTVGLLQPDGVYLVEGTLELSYVNHVTLDLNVATVVANTTGGSASRRHLTVDRSSNVVVAGGVIDGPNETGVYDDRYPFQHGVAITNSDHVRVTGMEIHHVYGDGVYMIKADDVEIDNNDLHDIGRQGIGVIDDSRVQIHHNTFNDIARSVIDFEQNDVAEIIEDVDIHDNTVGFFPNFFVAAEGAGVTRRINIHDNTVLKLKVTCASHATYRRHDWQITDNTNTGSEKGPMIYFASTDNVTITGNTQQFTSGASWNSITDCLNYTSANNTMTYTFDGSNVPELITTWPQPTYAPTATLADASAWWVASDVDTVNKRMVDQTGNGNHLRYGSSYPGDALIPNPTTAHDPSPAISGGHHVMAIRNDFLWAPHAAELEFGAEDWTSVMVLRSLHSSAEWRHAWGKVERTGPGTAYLGWFAIIFGSILNVNRANGAGFTRREVPYTKILTEPSFVPVVQSNTTLSAHGVTTLPDEHTPGGLLTTIARPVTGSPSTTAPLMVGRTTLTDALVNFDFYGLALFQGLSLSAQACLSVRDELLAAAAV